MDHYLTPKCCNAIPLVGNTINSRPFRQQAEIEEVKVTFPLHDHTFLRKFASPARSARTTPATTKAMRPTEAAKNKVEYPPKRITVTANIVVPISSTGTLRGSTDARPSNISDKTTVASRSKSASPVKNASLIKNPVCDSVSSAATVTASSTTPLSKRSALLDAGNAEKLTQSRRHTDPATGSLRSTVQNRPSWCSSTRKLDTVSSSATHTTMTKGIPVEECASDPARHTSRTAALIPENDHVDVRDAEIAQLKQEYGCDPASHPSNTPALTPENDHVDARHAEIAQLKQECASGSPSHTSSAAALTPENDHVDARDAEIAQLKQECAQLRQECAGACDNEKKMEERKRSIIQVYEARIAVLERKYNELLDRLFALGQETESMRLHETKLQEDCVHYAKGSRQKSEVIAAYYNQVQELTSQVKLLKNTVRERDLMIYDIEQLCRKLTHINEVTSLKDQWEIQEYLKKIGKLTELNEKHISRCIDLERKIGEMTRDQDRLVQECLEEDRLRNLRSKNNEVHSKEADEIQEKIIPATSETIELIVELGELNDQVMALSYPVTAVA